MGANPTRNTTSHFAFQSSALNLLYEAKAGKNRLTFSQTELTVCFYDEALDHPRENFEMIAKRVVPRGFGKAKTSATFQKKKLAECSISPARARRWRGGKKEI
jgi:hypothetical protein